MSKRDAASLICKGLSLYALVLGLGPLGQGLSMLLSNQGLQRYQGFDWPSTLITVGVPAALYLAVSLLLWLGAGPLSRAMAGREDNAAHAPGAPGDWEPFGVRLVGLLMLALSLPQIASLAATFTLLRTMPDEMSDVSSRWSAGIIPAASETVVRLAVGLWLLLGAPSILRALHGLRDVGRDEPLER